jgi:hypothetical protein
VGDTGIPRPQARARSGQKFFGLFFKKELPLAILALLIYLIEP